MSGNWVVDIAIALIGALGLIVPGWLTYKGMKVGREPKPEAVDDHGSPAWAIARDGSKTRDMLAREADETRRQLQAGFSEIRQQNSQVPWALLGSLGKLQQKD